METARLESETSGHAPSVALTGPSRPTGIAPPVVHRALVG
jgi:hypothetical protein